jgi:hypothetical protein
MSNETVVFLRRVFYTFLYDPGAKKLTSPKKVSVSQAYFLGQSCNNFDRLLGRKGKSVTTILFVITD